MKHELLAPAGSLEICKAVIAAGADAVYLGGSRYGARAFAQNFTEDEVMEALDYAHLYGRKIMMTVNTLLKNKEMGMELYEYLKPYYQHGLDAVIVQDFGVFQFIHKYFPELPVHISTQASVSNVDGVKFLLQQGAERIVTSRELSLEEIRRIYDETGAELECFIHGALCYCYSGQCLMSSMLGGRSGNRGRCAQPCRLAYEVIDDQGKVYHKQEKYPLSPKDLCTLDLIPKLCEAGIYSFKIEGRMKSKEYAAGVTSVYRKYLDLYEKNPEEFVVQDEDREYLLQLGNRNGFTKGYYEMRNGRSMITLTDSSHSSMNAKEVFRPVQLAKIPVFGKAMVRVGEPLQMKLWGSDGKVYVMAQGPEVSEAQKRPLAAEDVKERLSKTGDTAFEIKSLELEMDDSCFVPVGQLNELRRSALELFQKEILNSFCRRLPENQEVSLIMEMTARGVCETGDLTTDVWISDLVQLEEVLNHAFVNMVSLDLSGENQLFMEKGRESVSRFVQVMENLCQQIHKAGKKAAFCMPHVFRENSSTFFYEDECREMLSKFDLIWVRTYDELGYVLNYVKLSPDRIGLDDHLYAFSRDTAASFGKLGVYRYTASLELNQKELRHMPNTQAEFCVYGTIPMMISAQCVYKNYDHCYKQTQQEKSLFLKDRYFKEFLIKRYCKDCYNVIYNSQPLYLIHQADAVKKLNFGSFRICFVNENKGQVRKVLTDYRLAFAEGRKITPPEGKDSFTTGHFRRGVD